MADCNFLQKAIQFIQQAAEKDGAQDYPEALRLYQLAIEYFITALKYEKNDRNKAMIKAKVDEYFARAEHLKDYLDKASKKKKPVGATDGSSKGEADGEEDTEKSRFRLALGSAIVKETPNVRWDDVVGLFQAKEALREAVIMPIKFPQLFAGGLKPWKGILLYGPPGTGKSYLAKAVATEVKSTFFSVSSSDLVSKWLGESEKLVRNLFEMAREAKPAIIFIDEIDSLCSARNDQDSESAKRIKTEFLVQMNGVGKGDDTGVLVLGATNIPWILDPAVRRRFEKRIYISLPDAMARSKMFEINLRDGHHSIAPNDFRNLGQITEGYSGSDISIVVREAMMEPVRKVQSATHFRYVSAPSKDDPSVIFNDYITPCSPGDPAAFPLTWMEIEDGNKLLVPPVTHGDFLKALRQIKPSVSMGDLSEYEQWTTEFGQDG